MVHRVKQVQKAKDGRFVCIEALGMLDGLHLWKAMFDFAHGPKRVALAQDPFGSACGQTISLTRMITHSLTAFTEKVVIATGIL